MTRPWRLGLTPAIVLVFAFIAAGCGGSTASSAPDDSGTPPPEATATPPDAEPTGDAPTDAPSIGIPDLPDIDLGDLGALEGIDSYRMTVTVEGEVQYAATVVREPVEASDVTMGDVRIIVIGDEAWLDAGTGTFQSVPVATVGGMTNAFSPIMLFGAVGQMGALQGVNDLGVESKNGVQARHFRVDSSTPIVGPSIPSDAVIDIWVAEEGYLVSYAASGLGGGDMSLDLTNINDPSNTVEAP